uniref:DUF4283 domain-containing protein n=1 Tax=Cannabis sativa TaxID=3483 RepID=A0A803PH95_CANSA
MASSSGVANGGKEDVYSFQIEEEELAKLTVGNEGEEEGIDDRWCLVGRFLSNRMIDFDKIQNILASLWQPGMGMFVKKLDDNRFLFQFYHEVDIQGVVNGSPWTFDRMQLIIQRLPVGGDLNSLQLNHLDIWVQIHDVKPECMKEGTVRGVGNTLGKFIELDPNNFIGVWRDYLRVRVTLDIRKPLRRRMKLTHENAFRLDCETIYGDFIKALPQRTYKNIGARWLQNRGWQPVGITGDNAPGQSSNQPNMERNPSVDLAASHAHGNLLHNGENHDMDNIMMEGVQDEEFSSIKEGEVNGAIYGKNKEKELLDEYNSCVVIYDSKKRKVGGEGHLGHVGNKEKVVALSKKLGFEGCFAVDSQGRSGGLALLWKSEEEVIIDSYSLNHVDCFVHFEGQSKFRFTAFYWEPNRSLRKTYWEFLRTLHARFQEAWCIMGDFNNILHNKEKRGGNPYPSWLLDGFQEVVRHCGLYDLDLLGHSFTWEKSRDTSAWMEVRLDRTMANLAWLSRYPEAKLFNFAVSPSDHTHLFLDILHHIKPAGGNHFRFENYWTRFQECEEVIRDSWSRSGGSQMHQKLHQCGQDLQAWGTSVASTKREVANVQQMLQVFSNASGRRVNFGNSSGFFSSNTTSQKRETICNRLRIREAEENRKYLGLPSSIGRNKTGVFSFVVDKVQKRIQTWDNKLLSRASKEVLIKAVVQDLSAYTMNLFFLPLGTCHQMESAISRFWWKSNNSKGIHWLSWDKLTAHKVDGGMGFHDFRDFNLSLLAKQGWRLLSCEEMLATIVFKARYFASGVGSCWSEAFGGDGSRISILHEPWLIDDINPYIETFSSSLQGKLVNALMQIDRLEWDSEVISDVYERDKEMVWRIPLTAASRKDNWLKDSKGVFSVKSAYRLQHDINSHINHIVSTDLWRKMCFARSCWRQTKVPVVAPVAMTFRCWFEEGLTKWSEVESIEAAMTLWAVWKMQNDVVWSSISPSSEEVIHVATVNYSDWCNAQQFKKESLPVHSIVVPEKWCRPNFPCIKVNVDGAIFS